MDLTSIEQTGLVTDSNLSTWVGPATLVRGTVEAPPRGDDDMVEAEQFPWTNRMVCLTELNGTSTIDVGPGASSEGGINVLKALQEFKAHVTTAKLYEGFSYESISLRVTVSDPKGIVGGLIVGWFPYIDYFDKNEVQTVGEWLNDSNGAYFSLVNSSDSQLMLYGSSADAEFTIPWTFKYPYYRTKWFLNLNGHTGQAGRGPYGSPVFYWKQLNGAAYVNSVGTPGRLQVYAKMNGLKYYGPSPSDVQTQSGIETAAAVTVAAAVDTGMTYLTNKIMEHAEVPGQGPNTNTKAGNYDNPQAVQLAFFGDTTSVDFPQTRPIFKDNMTSLSSGKIPSVHELLSKPAYVGVFTSASGPQTFHATPTGIWPVSVGNWVASRSNYMGYFAMINRYWRGTINLHFVVAGHPMIEVALQAETYYPNTLASGVDIYGQISVHRSVFSGGRHVVVPMPYLVPQDYLPIGDRQGEDPPGASYVTAELSVINTMLDIAPTIPVYVFISAGPDFKFYQPFPPGLYNDAPPTASKKEKPVVRPPKTVVKAPSKKDAVYTQVGLPFAKELEVATTRAAVTPDPGLLPSFERIEDYMKIWSRCVPMRGYESNEEPTYNAPMAFMTPCWFPPVDRSIDIYADNSWWFTNDYVSFLSLLFVFWRGTLGAKVAVSSQTAASDGYVYVALSGSNQDSLRTPTRCPLTQESSNLPSSANFGTGCVVTPTASQPILEVSIPYRGSTIWSTCIFDAYGRGVVADDDYPPAEVITNIKVVNQDTLADAIFRKVDSDFALCVLSTLPPPAFWLNRGYNPQ